MSNKPTTNIEFQYYTWQMTIIDLSNFKIYKSKDKSSHKPNYVELTIHLKIQG
jgi:hypothetical protein